MSKKPYYFYYGICQPCHYYQLICISNPDTKFHKISTLSHKEPNYLQQSCLKNSTYKPKSQVSETLNEC